MNKKALTQEELVLLIFILAVMLVLAAGVYIYVKQIRTSTGIEGCRESILFQQNVATATKDVIGKTKISCPSSSVEITTSNKNGTLKQIADQLKDCWYKTLGSKNNMGLNTFWGVDFLSKDSAVCSVCSEFTLAQDIAPAELVNFLNTAYPANSKLVYKDYLVGMSWGSDKILMTTPAPGAITPFVFDAENENSLFPTALLKSSSAVENRYYVISQNMEGSKNQLLIVSTKNVPDLKCDIFYYKPAS